MQFFKEKWENIAGFTDKYEVSDQGRVRVIGKQRCLCLNRLSSGGYPRARLDLERVVGGRRRDIKVHRLVCEAFIGELPPGGHTRHINGDKFDNRLVNLKYGTIDENCADSRRLKQWASKLTREEVLRIRRSKKTAVELGDEFYVSVDHIRRIRRRLHWKGI